ncbi:MAG: hypothetical protein HYR96_08525 [Deltaproteobacteria bacterium]|nr:hypothetical protein [Deltaproteobacteria bacterium]MBI3294656.1 hypothetical protein [Deltaproteobacteria bacterium]
MLLYRVTEAFRKKRVEFAICGGWAVALYGAVRGTVDIDVALILSAANLERAERALNAIGLKSRLPLKAADVSQFREEYIRNRKMIAWRFINPTDPTEVVDLLINEDLSQYKRTNIKIGKQAIPLVAIEDLIRMKRLSGRPQDLEDVRALQALKK